MKRSVENAAGCDFSAATSRLLRRLWPLFKEGNDGDYCRNNVVVST